MSWLSWGAVVAAGVLVPVLAFVGYALTHPASVQRWLDGLFKREVRTRPLPEGHYYVPYWDRTRPGAA